MARRSRAFDKLVGGIVVVLILGGLATSLVRGLAEKIQKLDIAPVAAVVLAVCLVFIGRLLLRKRRERRELLAHAEAVRRRRENLLLKYHDPIVVDQIMVGGLWHDMSKEQLVDAWGSPLEIETKVMKTKIREVYKFRRTGVNRFALRVTIENDVVVGWDQK